MLNSAFRIRNEVFISVPNVGCCLQIPAVICYPMPRNSVTAEPARQESKSSWHALSTPCWNNFNLCNPRRYLVSTSAGAKRRRTAADQQRRSPFTTIRSLFFAADHQLLHHQYDFICCFRVFEHFRTPAKEWSLIETLLKPGGWLAISTPLLTSLTAFAKWHYKNNPTHVSFYQQQTFAYLASQGKFKLIFAAQDFILMQKHQDLL